MPLKKMSLSFLIKKIIVEFVLEKDKASIGVCFQFSNIQPIYKLKLKPAIRNM